jgi:uncharacterized membrane protein YbhN (UPF0104 family)
MLAITRALHTKRFYSALLTLSILGLLLGHMNMARMQNILLHVDALFVLAAMAMFTFQLFLMSARWDLLINLNHRYIPTADNARIFFGSNLINFIFLSSISGPIVRLALSIRAGSPWLNALCATIVDRCLSTFVLMSIGVMVLPFTFHIMGTIEITHAYIIMISMLFMSVIFGGVVLLFYSDYIKKMIGVRAFKVARAYGLRFIRSHHSTLTLFYSFTGQFAFFLGVYYILCAMNIPVSFSEMMSVLPVLLPILAVLISLPITIGGWGLRESGYVVGLGVLGIPMEVAFLASVLVGSFTMITSLVMAAPSAIHGLQTSELDRDFRPYHAMLAYLKRSKT